MATSLCWPSLASRDNRAIFREFRKQLSQTHTQTHDPISRLKNSADTASQVSALAICTSPTKTHPYYSLGRAFLGAPCRRRGAEGECFVQSGTCRCIYLVCPAEGCMRLDTACRTAFCASGRQGCQLSTAVSAIGARM